MRPSPRSGARFLAAVCCFVAAWRSRTSSDGKGWTLFGVAALLYFGGNLSYLAAALNGIDPGFPSPAEWAYLAMAPIFATGAFVYGRIGRRLSRTTLFNFLLIYCAITVATVLALENAVRTTGLPPLGMVVAVVYPAIWFSVAVACGLSLLQFNLAGRTLPFALMCCAAITEALADALYAGAILDQTYVRGGLTELLWVASIGLIVWAAIVQLASSRRPVRWFVAPKAFRRGMQAAIPGAAIAIALAAEVFHDGEVNTGYLGAILAIVVAFAAVAALREYWIGREQRLLQIAVEKSRIKTRRKRTAADLGARKHERQHHRARSRVADRVLQQPGGGTGEGERRHPARHEGRRVHADFPRIARGTSPRRGDEGAACRRLRDVLRGRGPLAEGPRLSDR